MSFRPNGSCDESLIFDRSGSHRWSRTLKHLPQMEAHIMDTGSVATCHNFVAEGVGVDSLPQAQDIYSINEHFGTSDDLKNLSTALHKRGMVRNISDSLCLHIALIAHSISWSMLSRIIWLMPAVANAWTTAHLHHSTSNRTFTHFA